MGKSKGLIKPYTKGDKNNVLVVGDLHAPFILKGYLEWVREQQEKYHCGEVVFIGDILDAGAWNFHEKDPDGMGVKEELDATRKQLSKVFAMFPKATCLLGNHDLLVARKAKFVGLSQEFVKPLAEILGAPKSWTFLHEYYKHGVRYIHGDRGDAFKQARETRMSTVQGHLHSQAFVQWSVSERDAIFGLQLGAGLDRHQYAFAYAKNMTKKPIISCGVVLDKGRTPMILLMPI